jgi:hypothetical protein
MQLRRIGCQYRSPTNAWQRPPPQIVNFTLTAYKPRALHGTIAFTQSELVNVDGNVNFMGAFVSRLAAAPAGNGGQPRAFCDLPASARIAKTPESQRRLETKS